MRRLRRTAAIAATAVLSAAGLVAYADPAAADGYGYGCAGRLVHSFSHYDTRDGELAARSYVYWDGKDSCARLVKVKDRGAPTTLHLDICADGECGNDWDQYRYQAVAAVNGDHCVSVEVAGFTAAEQEIYHDRLPGTGFAHCD
ncbi:MAG: hypothetical protein HOV77_25110 [Hamadaea sp.]|uniref:hypothetical protein n=1 Tax=Hamadaea sp. TaxID=2024425 RepID=UPI00179842D2|nr:hypothetical protein [Hamadaea sp.]NUT22465.1 hypothetical protein [Hamadaea sp.]